jgi:hypothetical protein
MNALNPYQASIFKAALGVASCLASIQVMASGEPSGLAGRAVTMPASALFIGGQGQYFEWYQYFGAHQISGGAVAELNFAIVPFDAGTTAIGLDGEGGPTFVTLDFHDGLLNSTVRYEPTAWNIVKVSIEFAQQQYWAELNGVSGGPFPFAGWSDSIQAFRVNYNGPGSAPATAWFDSLELSSGNEVLLRVDFDGNNHAPEGLCEWCGLEPSTYGSEPPPPYVNATRPPSRYQGLAARAESVLDEWMPGLPTFEWYQYFGSRRVAPAQAVKLSLAILPFAGESNPITAIGMDGDEGATFVSVSFENGMAEGGVAVDGVATRRVAYDPANWNTVEVVADFTTQSYTLAVNGIAAGRFKFQQPSESVQAFRLNGGSRTIHPVVAWIDSVRLTLSEVTIADFDFDHTPSDPLNLDGRGRLTIEDPESEDSGRITQAKPGMVLSLKRNGNGLTLSWPNDTTIALKVSASPSGPWQPVEAEVLSDANSFSIQLTPNSIGAFYRLERSP